MEFFSGFFCEITGTAYMLLFGLSINGRIQKSKEQPQLIASCLVLLVFFYILGVQHVFVSPFLFCIFAWGERVSAWS